MRVVSRATRGRPALRRALSGATTGKAPGTGRSDARRRRWRLRTPFRSSAVRRAGSCRGRRRLGPLPSPPAPGRRTVRDAARRSATRGAASRRRAALRGRGHPRRPAGAVPLRRPSPRPVSSRRTRRARRLRVFGVPLAALPVPSRADPDAGGLRAPARPWGLPRRRTGGRGVPRRRNTRPPSSARECPSTRRPWRLRARRFGRLRPAGSSLFRWNPSGRGKPPPRRDRSSDSFRVAERARDGGSGAGRRLRSGSNAPCRAARDHRPRIRHRGGGGLRRSRPVRGRRNVRAVRAAGAAPSRTG